MMADHDYKLCLEPSSTLDLLNIYQKAPEGSEKTVLRDIITHMIRLFQDHPEYSYLEEAALLSSIVQDSPDKYETLLVAIGNVIMDQNDGTIMGPKVLKSFTFCIRQASDDPSVNSRLNAPLVLVLHNLQGRLEISTNLSQPEKQYEIVSTLCFILDAMGDIGVNGVSREHTHNPLLQSLGSLREAKEPRLAQSASYAYQALLGISDDESKLSRFWRNAGDIIIPLANVAGAAATFDPTKVVDATPHVMKMLSTISTMVTSAQKIFDETQSLKDTAKSIGSNLEQQDWYLALRYSDLLITASAFKSLEYFLSAVPCANQDNFLSGIFAQLERAWHQSPKDRKKETKTAIANLVDSLILRVDYKKRLASAWLDILAETFDQPGWKKAAKPRKKLWPWWRKKGEKREENLQSSQVRPFYANENSLEPRSELLKLAISRCDEALRYYASNELAKFYSKGHLDIKRLSGELLHMDQCYINLAIIQATSSKAERPPAFDLSERSLPTPTDAEKSMTLPALFDKREVDGGHLIEPRRIIIRGRAGVGKSTLCKKIVHEFLRGQLWSDLFDRVIWIPLRNIARKPTLKDIFDEYLQNSSSQIDRKDLVHALEKTVNNTKSNNRTLLLLDGLDEVPGDAIDLPFVKSLLNHPSVIITSRPFAVHFDGLDPVHLELETVGFQEEQVQSYLSKIVTEYSRREAIKDFIDNNWLIQSLVQIPIQLDALCYSWDDEFASDGTTTMTTLYEQIETRLWRKDLIQLGKAQPNRKVLYRDQLEEDVGNEMNFLEFLAFTGLTNNVIIFDEKIRREIDRHYRMICKKSGFGGVSDNTLDKLSFLRTTDSLKRNISTYHFLHLTFQEYFAARYFIRCWASQEPVRVLEIHPTGNSILKDVSTERFLKDQKYNGRYDVFWRFVTGLLCSEGEMYLDQLLEKTKEEPHDLLGIAHMRLLMHCLNEIPVAFTKQHKELESLCRIWFEFEKILFIIRYEGYLVFDAEFPRDVLQQMLRRNHVAEGEQAGWLALEAIGARPALTHGLQDSLVSILTDESRPMDQRKKATRALENDPRLSEQCQRALREQLKKPLATTLLGSILEILLGQTSISEENLSIAVGYLDDNRDEVACHAFSCLHSISPMPEAVLQSLIDWFLKYQRRGGEVFSAGSIGSFLERAESRQNDLLQPLKDQDLNTKIWWCNMFRRQDYVSDVVLDYLTSCMFDENLEVRFEASYDLGGLFGFSSCRPSEAVLTNLASQLAAGENSRLFNEPIMNVLCGDFALPDAVIDILISKLSMGITGAFEILCSKQNLPDRAIDALMKLTNDPEESIRDDAIVVLGAQVFLSDEYCVHLFRQIKEDNSLINKLCASSQWKQRKLPSFLVDALVRIIKDDSQSESGQTALLALARQSKLPDGVLEVMIEPAMAYLQREGHYGDSILDLTRHLSFSKEFRDVLMDLFQSTTKDYTYVEVVRALDQNSLVTKEVADAMLSKLEPGQSDYTVKSVAWKHLPSSILSSPRTLSMCYRFLFSKCVDENFALYAERGAIYILSSRGRKELSLEMDVEDVISMLSAEATQYGNPVAELYRSSGL